MFRFPYLFLFYLDLIDSEGPEISYSFHVYNSGFVDSGSSYAGIWLSLDLNLVAGEDFLVDTKYVPGIVARGNHVMTTTTYIGCSVDPGNYYLFVRLDEFGTVAESSEDDNTDYYMYHQVLVSSHVDLIPLFVLLDYNTDTFELQYHIEIQNRGNTGSGEYETFVYYSTDNIITTSDNFLAMHYHYGSVDPCDINSVNSSNDYLKNMSPGDYYLGCIVDPDNDTLTLVIDSSSGYSINGTTITPDSGIQEEDLLVQIHVNDGESVVEPLSQDSDPFFLNVHV